MGMMTLAQEAASGRRIAARLLCAQKAKGRLGQLSERVCAASVTLEALTGLSRRVWMNRNHLADFGIVRHAL
jgi:hypothetical protein